MTYQDPKILSFVKNNKLQSYFLLIALILSFIPLFINQRHGTHTFSILNFLPSSSNDLFINLCINIELLILLVILMELFSLIKELRIWRKEQKVLLMSTKEEINWKNQINLGNILIQRSSKILLLQNIGLLIPAISVLSFDPSIFKLIPLILLMDIIGFFLLGIGFFFLGKIKEQTEKNGKYILLMSLAWIFLTILWRGGPIYNLLEYFPPTPGIMLVELWVPSLLLLILIIYNIKKVLSALIYRVNTIIYNLYLVSTLVFLALFILFLINLYLQPNGTGEYIITREALLLIFLMFLKSVVITIIGSIMFNKLGHDVLLIIASLPDSIETHDDNILSELKSSL